MQPVGFVMETVSQPIFFVMDNLMQTISLLLQGVFAFIGVAINRQRHAFNDYFFN